MEQKLLKDLKKGEFFTKMPIEEPKETQVLIRGDYDRGEKSTISPVFLIFATRHISRARRKFTRDSRSKNL